MKLPADGKPIAIDWLDISRLLTAVGSLTLALRGSDKSLYGKLFERLVLGSVLTILGFEQVDSRTNTKDRNIFWLSDSRDDRESDATLLIAPGKLARFDIGFIGVGNSEISKDKLSRYSRTFELSGASHSSSTFIIVDRLPETSKTPEQAKKIGAVIIQMAMQLWPQQLARELGARYGFNHPLQKMAEADVPAYLSRAIEHCPVQQYVTGLTVEAPSEEAG